MSKTIKELFADAGVENAELVAGVQSLLDSKGEGGIPYSRFKEKVGQYNEAVANTAELETKIEQLTKQNAVQKTEINELGTFKTQVNEWKTKKFETDKTEWLKRKDIFEAKEGDKIFDKISKVKHRFKFGEDLSQEQLSTNLEMLKTYDELDYFKVDGDKTNYNSNKAVGGERKKADGDFYGYENVEALARADWKLYEKWKKEKK
jgi:hypothetical protein